MEQWRRGGGRGEGRTSHEGMTEVVLAVLVIFDVFPFEFCAAAAVEVEGGNLSVLSMALGLKGFGGALPAAFFADACDEIHCYVGGEGRVVAEVELRQGAAFVDGVWRREGLPKDYFPYLHGPTIVSFNTISTFNTFSQWSIASVNLG